MSSVYLASEFVPVTCNGPGGCGGLSAMSRAHYDATQRSCKTFWCPICGHSWVWKGKSVEEKLRDAEATATHLADQLRAAEADAEAARTRLIRDQHRFANGVCPCCNRSFDNVRRHMETQHPDFDPGPVAKPVRYRCSCGREFDTPHGLRIHQARTRPANWTDPSRSDYSRHLTRA